MSKNKMANLIILLISFFLFLLMAVTIIKTVFNNSKYAIEISELEDELNKKIKKKEELEQKLIEETSKEGIEKLAREKLNMKKKGERVFKIIGDKLEEKNTDISPLTNKEKKELEQIKEKKDE